MQNQSVSPIPISVSAPLVLERPLKLFGNSFSVHISTALTISPNTMLLVTYGMSLRQLTRKLDIGLDTSLKDLWRGALKKNRLSETTQTLIRQRFGQRISSSILDEVMAGREPSSALPWHSDWDALLEGMGEPEGPDDFIYTIVERFAKLDRIFWTSQQLHATGAVDDGAALLDRHIGDPIEGWRKCNASISVPVAVLIDVILQTLARLEFQNWPSQSTEDSRIPKSLILPWLAPGKKPIGHWLLTMLTAAGCKNLGDFGVHLEINNIKRHTNPVSHNLLKKWSSGGQLMPSEGCECVLMAVGKQLDLDHERGKFGMVRLLSFLCDLVISGTRSTPPSWNDAQAQLSRRYSEIYYQEHLRLMAS